MGELVGGIFEFGFDLPDEGYYVLKVEEVDVVPAENGGLTYKLTAVIDGGAFDGQKHWENFSTRTKKYFGIKKMVGFLIKAGKMAKDAKIDSDLVENDGFKKDFIKMVRGARYGAYLSHREWKDREGQVKNSTQSDKYMTVEEVRQKMQEMEKPGSTLTREKPEEAPKPAPKPSVWK